MTTYYEKPFIFENEAVKKNVVKVTAGKDVNDDFYVVVDVFLQVEKTFKPMYGGRVIGEEKTDLFGYHMKYNIFTEDGGIIDDEPILLNVEGMPRDILKECIEKSRQLAHEKLADLQKAGEIKTSSIVRKNIESLIASGISAYSVSKATGIPNNTVVRIFRGEAKIDNITLRNAELLSSYWEEMNKES